MNKKVVLTGDRSTGKLHLGHYVGSLANRLKMQDEYKQFVMIADMQALTDHAEKPELIRNSVMEVMLDYLAVGLDPKKTTILLQSMIPELSELTMYYLNLVTWNRLKHNPTVKQEIKQKNFGESVPAGFMVYPVFQAADITAFKADIVPVGDDQLPMIEQTNEIVRKFNRIYKKEILKEAKAITPQIARLPGIDGNAKMSKSLNNAIYLSDEADVLVKKVKSMFTDSNHLRVEDPGKVEGNPVFVYLDAFAKDTKKVNEMKEHYQKGGLGDMVCKKYLIEVLEDFLSPIREKRKELEKDKKYVLDVLLKGSIEAKKTASQTLKEVKEAMHLISA
ncbi:MAG: Tryptophan--tRNA ligase 2 [Candidatus Anoxychlamydiales bacterium]|nr:Tryptophan--tRNA ligase 2 [Candidatus Anoxychlamydiales bacterium]